jgi:xylulokinase
VHLDAASLAEPDVERVAAYEGAYQRYLAALGQRHTL